MKTALALTLAFAALPSFADQLIQIPGGGHCWLGENGSVWGCSGTGGSASGASSQDQARLQEARNERHRQGRTSEMLARSGHAGTARTR